MHLTSEERAHAIQLLHDSQAEFLELTSGLTDAQWNYRPGPECWSLGETAEHIVLAEAAMFSRVRKALNSPPDADWESKTRVKTEFLERNVPDRSQPFAAPEYLRPRAQWSAQETIARFKECRAKGLQFIEETDRPLKTHVSEHPSPVFGTLNAYQWLLYISLHNMRHNRQIAQAKGGPEFPL